MSIRIFVSVIALLLGACATQNVDRGYKLQADAKEGVATGSVTYSGGFSGYGVHFRQLPSGITGKFETGQAVVLIPLPSKGDFEGNNPTGTVFATALPPGEYEIYRWTIGSGPANTSSTVPFSIRFKVEPGKISYLGSFHFTQTSALGLTVTGGTLAYFDAIERDHTVIKTKFPGLSETPISYAIAPGTNQLKVGGQSMSTITLPTYLPIKR